MRRGHRFVMALGGAAALASWPAPARAQELSIRAARRDTIVATSTVSAAFLLQNARPESASVRLRLELPQDWTALAAGSDVVVPPRSGEMFILSVVVPGRTLAGTYPVRVWATSTADPRGVSDSVLVRVAERSATDITLLDRPGYVVSGRAYEAGFQVRNRGNVETTLHLAARSSVGAVILSDTLVTLVPNESKLVRARMQTPPGMNAAADDVVEIIATRPGQTVAEVRGSSRVTVVPEPGRTIEQFLKIPTRVSLRAATSDAVSPFEVHGRGPVIDGSPMRLDFLVRGPTGTGSAFGERDEYRVELSAPDWRVRGGDQVFMISSLTAAGQPGFGVGAEGSRGMVSAGAYSQQFRRVPEKGTEHGAFAALSPTSRSRLGLNVVDRAGGALPGRVGSASGALETDYFSTELEVARSRVDASVGTARSARLSGTLPLGSFDLGHLYADTSFSGSQRGAEHNYVTATSLPIGPVAFGLNGSVHRTDLSRSTGVPYEERFRTGAVSTTLFQRYTVELGTVFRGTTVQAVETSGDQWSVRGRADHDFPVATLMLEVEGGRSADAGLEREFTDVGVGARRSFLWGSGSLYARRYSGGALTKGMDASHTLGGDASFHLGPTLGATIIGYATRHETPGAEWHSQVDALLTHSLRSGATITLRARLLGGGNRTASQQSVAYLEYGMPFRLPVSPLRTPGRVMGRVVDAVTGRGVPGALVRLGPQVAITDGSGKVAFGGVPGGQHRLSMSQEVSFANAVFIGDPTLVVDSARETPTTFSLAIARSARLDVDVRRFSALRTALNGADSLRDAGAVSNALLVLAGERDTLYRNTGENGRAAFTDIPPGAWTLSIRGDTPAFTRFEPDRVELTLAPGEARTLSFRLIPRKREVQMIGDGQELTPTAAEGRNAPQNTGTRTVKPHEKRPDR